MNWFLDGMNSTTGRWEIESSVPNRNLLACNASNLNDLPDARDDLSSLLNISSLQKIEMSILL